MYGGLDAEVEHMIKGCEICLSLLPDPPKASVINWERPVKPWERIHVDFDGPLRGLNFLVISFQSGLRYFIPKRETRHST